MCLLENAYVFATVCLTKYMYKILSLSIRLCPFACVLLCVHIRRRSCKISGYAMYCTVWGMYAYLLVDGWGFISYTCLLALLTVSVSEWNVVVRYFHASLPVFLVWFKTSKGLDDWPVDIWEQYYRGVATRRSSNITEILQQELDSRKDKDAQMLATLIKE